MSAIATTHPRLRAAGRRHPALPAALWRHRDAARQDARRTSACSACGFVDGVDEAGDARGRGRGARGRAASPMIFIETPSNPMNTLVDIAAGAAHRRGDRRARRAHGPLIVLRQHAARARSSSSRSQHGADISLYSLTKYVGGHSDLIAGAALGATSALRPIRAAAQRPSARSSIRIPAGCWAARSRRLALRMERANRNAASSPTILPDHPRVARGALSRRSCRRVTRRARLFERAVGRRRARPSPSTSRAARRRRSRS